MQLDLFSLQSSPTCTKALSEFLGRANQPQSAIMVNYQVMFWLFSAEEMQGTLL